MSRSRLIFLVLSITLATLDGTLVWISSRALDQEMRQQLRTEAEQFRAAFDTVLDQTYSNLEMIATFVANDGEAQRLFLEGVRAVRAEGGGPGGPEASRLRSELYSVLSDKWAQVQSRFAARQLHFHLGPGSTSFLRVHRPTRFGDNMDDVRFTVVDTNREQLPRTGFETGRVYSGLRGVVPVFAYDPETGDRVHAGALEAGTAFDHVLGIIGRNYDVNVAVLLREEHVRRNMWPEAVDRQFESIIASCRCFVEGTTDPAIVAVVDAVGNGRRALRDLEEALVTVAGQPTLVATRALRDYRASRDPALPDVGRVVFWRDETSLVSGVEAKKRFTLAFAVGAYMLVECLLFFAIRQTTRRLESEVAERVRDIRRSERRLRRAQTIAGLGNWDWETGGTRVLLSEQGQRMLGLSAPEGMSTLAAVLARVHPEDRATVEAAMREAAGSGKNLKLDHRILGAEGERVVQHFAEAERGPDGQVQLSSTLFDITERFHQQQALEAMASHDGLTGILNRRGFREQAGKALQRANRERTGVSLLMIDADHFKAINDRHGHEAGDRVLKAITAAVAGELRQYDIFGRLGGEEFAALLPATDPNSANAVAQRILEAVRVTGVDLPGNGRVTCTVSIGIAICRLPPKSLDSLLGRADGALYEAKTGGRDRYSLAEEPGQDNDAG